MTSLRLVTLFLLSTAWPCTVYSFSFTNLLYHIHVCKHPHPGPLGCGPPHCEGGPKLSQCRLYDCEDGSPCQFKYDNDGSSSSSSSSSNSEKYRLCTDDEDCEYTACEDGDSGCTYTCDDNGCSLISSSSSCTEGDDECYNFFEYYQNEKESNSEEATAIEKVQRAAVYYFLPLILLVFFFAYVIRPWMKTREDHPLKGALKKRMKLFSRGCPTKARQSGADNLSSDGTEDSYRSVSEDGTVEV